MGQEGSVCRLTEACSRLPPASALLPLLAAAQTRRQAASCWHTLYCRRLVGSGRVPL